MSAIFQSPSDSSSRRGENEMKMGLAEFYYALLPSYCDQSTSFHNSRICIRVAVQQWIPSTQRMCLIQICSNMHAALQFAFEPTTAICVRLVVCVSVYCKCANRLRYPIFPFIHRIKFGRLGNTPRISVCSRSTSIQQPPSTESRARRHTKHIHCQTKNRRGSARKKGRAFNEDIESPDDGRWWVTVGAGGSVYRCKLTFCPDHRLTRLLFFFFFFWIAPYSTLMKRK